MPETESDSCDERRHVGQRLLALGGDPPALVADAPRQPDEQRQRARARTAPAASRAGTCATIVAITVVTFETIDVAVIVTTLCDAADVVGDARLHLAGARPGEEGERHPLQVAVDRARRSCMTRWPTRFERYVWHDAERRRGDRDRDHAGDEQRQRARVAARDRVVEDAGWSRNGEIHPEQRARRGSAEHGASRSRYGRKSPTTRRRLARRTPGSAGRSGF